MEQVQCEFAPSPEKKVASRFVEGVYIVEVDHTLAEALLSPEADAEGFFRRAGAESAERLIPYDPEFEERHIEAGLHKMYVVKYATDVPATKASVSLTSLPGVVSVEQEPKRKSTAIFNDPRYGQQWQYYNAGTRSGYRAGADINVEPVWKDFTGGKPEVIVSIVDGGVDLNHQDLSAVCLPGGANGSKNFIDNTYNVTAHDHGTHVAGTVGAINNNGIGVAGVAGGTDGKGGVSIMSCQVFDSRGNSGGFYQAMVWGADHGAVISQNSWGNDYDGNYSAAKNDDVGYMKSAIDYFIRYAGTDKKGNQTGPMKGGVVIFAAGNDNWDIGWPCAYGGEGDTEGLCIAVGSFGAGGTKASYSNYGDWVDIAGPGGDAYAGNQILSTMPNNNYGSFQGTSMACPHVSGVAALIVSYFGGPGFTNKMLMERLIGGAKEGYFSSSSKIGPKVDAYGSFMYGKNMAPNPVDSYTVTASGNSFDFTWKVGASDEGDVAFGYTVFAAKTAAELSGKPNNFASSVASSSIETSQMEVGTEVSHFVSGLEFSRNYYVAVAGYDYNHNYSALSEIKQISTKANSAPVVETGYTGDYKVKSCQTLQVRYKVYDPDHHTVNVVTSAGSRAAKITADSDGTYVLSIDGSKVQEGVYTANITATDSYGLKTSKDIKYTILPNFEPEVVKPIDNYVFSALGKTIELNMDEFIYDEDEEVLTYEVSHTNSKVANLNAVGNMLYLTSLNWGLDEIKIVASDARGAECELTFKVSVRNPESEADVYPTQVTKYLHIGGGVEAETIVKIYNASGVLCYSKTSMTSAFSPLVINMSSFAPGIYRVEVTIEDKTTVRTVVKL